MVYLGTVKNGGIVLDAEAHLEEGATVRIVVGDAADKESTLADLFQDIAGRAVGLPDDLAENHDHYLHGLPKRTPA